VNVLTDNVFRQLVSRAIRTDYLENLTGFAWLLLQPLLLLAVYAFVFTTVFKARVADADGIGFVPFLAVAFWPWTAFSEAVLRSSASVTSNAALIGKVAFPSELLPLSVVVSTFLMQTAGYFAVLLVRQVLGTSIHWLGLIAALPLLLLLCLFASGLALMTFWFFTTPILYGTGLLPAAMARVLQFNPMAWYVNRLRDFLLFGKFSLRWEDLAVPLLTLLLFWIALKFFRRFSAHFEDFL